MRILLGITGSVAAVLAKKLTDELQKAGHEVQIVATRASLYFFKKEDLNVKVWCDEDEWPTGGYIKNMPVEHIRLRDWAEILLIAPLTANTLAKLANGVCDNLLTCIFRAWEPSKPIVLAPAMNTKMWEHPFTARHFQSLEDLQKFGYLIQVINPISKKLACGDSGIGAMADIESIVRTINTLKK